MWSIRDGMCHVILGYKQLLKCHWMPGDCQDPSRHLAHSTTFLRKQILRIMRHVKTCFEAGLFFNSVFVHRKCEIHILAKSQMIIKRLHSALNDKSSVNIFQKQKNLYRLVRLKNSKAGIPMKPHIKSLAGNSTMIAECL